MSAAQPEGSILEKIRQHSYWYHNFDLGNGEEIKGYVSKGMPKAALPEENFRFYDIPASLKGWTVLDIAGWDGALSFEAEKRGAERVVLNNLRNIADGDYALAGAGSWEVYKTNFRNPPYSHWLEDGFFSKGARLLRQYFDSKLEILEGTVYELDKKAQSQFDLVLCCGLLYHLRDPCLALQVCRKLTKRQVIVETMCIGNSWRVRASKLLRLHPVIEYWPHQGDGSDWWSFSVEALKAMMEDAGFRNVSVQQQIDTRCVLRGFV
jgi:tRNA (mo5U34)-methyltransferase